MDTSKNTKSDDLKVESVHVEEVEQPKAAKPTYRYVCEACSGVAFYGSEGSKHPSTCGTCFAPLGTIKKENFIKL